MHHCFWQKICWLFGSKNFQSFHVASILVLPFPKSDSFANDKSPSEKEQQDNPPTTNPQGKKYQTLMTRRFFDSEERPGTPRSFRIFSRLLHGDLAVAPYVRWWCPSIFWDWFKASKRWTMWISSGRWWLFSSLQICEIPQPLQTFFKTTSWISKKLSKSYRSCQAHMRLQIKQIKKMQLWLGFSRLPSIFFLQIIVFWWPCPPR